MNSLDINHFTILLHRVKSLPETQRKLLYISGHSNETVKKLFYYACSENHSFGVTKEQCLNYTGIISDFHEYNDVFDLFDSIIYQSITSESAIIGLIMGVAENLSTENKETFLNIIDKNIGLNLDIYDLNVALGLGYWDEWFIEEYNEVLFKTSKYTHKNKYKELVA